MTLNVNGLKAPTKRHRLAELIEKQDPYICCINKMWCVYTHTHNGKYSAIKRNKIIPLAATWMGTIDTN